MGKKKSAVCLILITILIVVLCAWCTVSFSSGIYNYNSVISVIKKDATLGGGYTVVYYPEGVISAEDYDANVLSYGESATQERDEYVAKYQGYGTGAIYLEKDVVLNDQGEVSDTFKASFENNVKALKERFEATHLEGVRVDVSDGYTVRVTLPELTDTAAALFEYFSYTGEVTVAYGSQDVKIIEETSKINVKDYLKGAYAVTAQNVSYVVVDFTSAGRQLIKDKTSGAAESSSTMYFMVGDHSIINLTVSTQIDQDSLYISGSYTAETAEMTAILFNTALNGTQTDLAMTVGDMQTHEATFGANTMLFVYIGIGALMLAMAIFFIARYRALGVTHVYAYLTFAICMVLCLAFIDFVNLGLGGVAAFVLTSLLLCASNVTTFEYAKKEYALGKTMTSSVKTGYKKCFWHLFDLHVALALVAFLIFAIALTELQMFAFIFGIGVLFSGVISLGITRFYWAIMMALSKKKGSFCNFKRGEEVDDE